MNRLTRCSAVFAAALATAPVLAQEAPTSLQAPVVSTQDDDDDDRGHILVPILAFIFFTATMGPGGGAVVVAQQGSDWQLKTDIAPVGLAANGLTLYEFRYVGGAQRYRGVMAQEVQTRFPGAVVEMPSGYLAVDYAALGLEMVAVD